MNKAGTNLPRYSHPRVDGLSGSLDCLYWHGRSGRRYIHTIFSFADWPGHSDANILLVRRHEDGSRAALWAGQTGTIPALLSDPGALDRAREQGANEIHVHLLGDDALMRQCITEDLAVVVAPDNIVTPPVTVQVRPAKPHRGSARPVDGNHLLNYADCPDLAGGRLMPADRTPH